MAKRTIGKLIGQGVVGFSILMASTSLSQAQSSDVQALLDRINRLEADLNNVQRKVYQGQDIPPPANISSSRSGAAPVLPGGEAAAILSSRIDSLEVEQRRLTGLLEESNFKMDQVTRRLDKLVMDVDFRLTELERQAAAGGASGMNANPTEGGGEGAANAGSANSGAANTEAGTATAKGPQVLGTLRIPTEGGTSPASAGAGDTVASLPADQSNVQRDPAEQYNYAISLVRQDRYAEAEKAFADFLAANPEHSLAGNSQYWLGETFYVREDFPNAASAFLNGYRNYPDSSKAADNLLKLAMALGRMNQIEESCASFRQLDKQFDRLPARLQRIADREKEKFGCS
ncbi:tol-pal system protein YbgF [Sneathiella chinensis]|uniref:Cell division coordinator CpoB n=1 Tax=Sneathiella chinensis TaxID=349750 RepID=A0ABQ5U505_9PROT|nr:tol-pal system protein YbgF [Sneathiella chinensis]GLQ06333.1 hypothetical protein GCM10007924_15540 [Sneathiella chinensis]